MKNNITLTIDTETADVLRQVLNNEIFKLEMNLFDNIYHSQEMKLVIKEIDSMNDLLIQLNQKGLA
jgi:hypothetical protein